MSAFTQCALVTEYNYPMFQQLFVIRGQKLPLGHHFLSKEMVPVKLQIYRAKKWPVCHPGCATAGELFSSAPQIEIPPWEKRAILRPHISSAPTSSLNTIVDSLTLRNLIAMYIRLTSHSWADIDPSLLSTFMLYRALCAMGAFAGFFLSS